VGELTKFELERSTDGGKGGGKGGESATRRETRARDRRASFKQWRRETPLYRKGG